MKKEQRLKIDKLIVIAHKYQAQASQTLIYRNR